jgi:hypothetical protein
VCYLWLLGDVAVGELAGEDAVDAWKRMKICRECLEKGGTTRECLE